MIGLPIAKGTAGAVETVTCKALDDPVCPQATLNACPVVYGAAPLILGVHVAKYEVEGPLPSCNPVTPFCCWLAT